MPIDAIERVYIKELDRYSDQLINEIKNFLKTPPALRIAGTLCASKKNQNGIFR